MCTVQSAKTGKNAALVLSRSEHKLGDDGPRASVSSPTQRGLHPGPPLPARGGEVTSVCGECLMPGLGEG